jgi:hypothetical protein
VQARFDSDGPWLGASRSEVATLRVAAPTTPNAVWLVAPFSLCAILLWLLTRRDLQQRDEQRGAPPPLGAGFHPSHRGAGHAADRVRIWGEVRDAVNGRAVHGATLSLELAALRVELTSVEGGRFESRDLAPGVWMLRVQASGYAALTSKVVVPHRGEWSDVQVLLASLRSAAVDAYRPAAARALPSLALWESWTARETLANAQRNGHAPLSFVQLTDRVELAAYARIPHHR